MNMMQAVKRKVKRRNFTVSDESAPTNGAQSELCNADLLQANPSQTVENLQNYQLY